MLHKNISLFEKFLPYYQDSYTFQLCPKECIDDVVTFIDTHWKKNHAFVLSKPLLDWQYYDPMKERYNFSLAVHKQTGEIHAMVGITCTSHFDSAILRPVRWGSLLKLRSDAEPGLGLMVEWYKNEAAPGCADVGMGESPVAIRLARKTGAATGVADQYYILHPEMRDFSIAGGVGNAPRHNPLAAPSNKRLQDCPPDSFSFLNGRVLEGIPFFKSKRYYENRFFRHPVYRYRATKICGAEGRCEGVFFWRLCEAQGAKCIRIVDYFGLPGALEGCLRGFEELLMEWNAEYVDFLCVGMPEDELKQAGFVERHAYPALIVPNYFEPFVRENVDITYSHMGAPEAGRIFKGDSDQDRPNLITSEV